MQYNIISNYRSENNKVFVKLTHSNKINIQNNQKIFLFDENREVLTLNEKPYNKYTYDYIFSDFENPMIISSTLNAFIYPLIEGEKNLLFMTVGQKNLGNFLFGSNQNFFLGNNLLFKLFTFSNFSSKFLEYCNLSYTGKNSITL